MEKNTACCFTGHRILGKNFSNEKLYEAVLCLVKNHGVSTFICGGALGFDTVAAEAVLRARNEGCDVKLHIYVPCSNQSEKWSPQQKQKYNEILEKADYVDRVNRPYFDGCMKIRNYKMVDNSAYCICYYNEPESRPSGTGQTVRYAIRSGLSVINVAV